jgi:hypothetical protein
MKKTYPLAVILLFITSAIYGQLDTFDLSRYKLPDIKRSQLDLNIDMNSLNSLTKENPENYGEVKNSSNTLNGSVMLNYQFYRNSDKIQSDQHYKIELVPDFSSQGFGDTASDKTQTLTALTFVTSINRIYFDNEFFFEPDVSFSWRTCFQNRDNDLTQFEDAWKYTQVDVEVPLLAGKGRIEQIQDARLAIYILEDLYKAGRIARMPDNYEILAFASLISEIKNERFFDHRIKKMYEIEKVDSFLQSNALITQADTRYFSTVNDNWDYSSWPVRESGRRISLGLVPDMYYYYSYEQTSFDTSLNNLINKNSQSSYGIKAVVEFDAAKPISLHWQRNLSASLTYGYNRSLINYLTAETEYDLGSLNLCGNFMYEVGYYPNSRTDLTGRLYFYFLRSSQQHNYMFETPDKMIYTGIAPRFSLDLNYYISPQTRLNVSYELYYAFSNSNIKSYSPEFIFYKTNTFRQDLSVGFLYSFF